MPYEPYGEQHRSDLYDEALKRVKAIWTLARREFGIKESFDVTFGAMNDDSMARVPSPHSHVIPRKERANMVVLRVSKQELERADFAETVLPREMAHVVCKIKPALGNPFAVDDGWQKVYQKLGGKC
ncbi:MAG TPA: hypothetical protein VN679_15280 [Candidatus Acidoferrales bacterium]|jgi:diadenosine tetraphosphate (Ap4A) HIT family hydrolase|nr:hypothetical protein [Candidatus Acidoferrales bacterium]